MRTSKPNRKILIPVLSALIGAAAGFSIFLLTGQIIFLIAFVPISTVLGIVFTHPEGQDQASDEPGVK